MGSMTLLGAGKPPIVGAASYIGPGDVAGYSSAYAYWGLRGYTATYSTGSNPAIDVVDQSAANLTTINITAAGDLDLAALSTWVTAHSVTRIGVRKLYDQSGNGRHATTPSSQEPALVLSGVGFGTKPVMAFDSGATNSPNFSTSTLAALPQPFTVSAIARFNTPSFPGALYGNGTAGVVSTYIKIFSSASEAQFAASAQFSSIPDNQFFAVQSVLNNTSSYLTFSNAGTNPTGAAGSNTSPGTNSIALNDQFFIGADTTNIDVLNGYIFEMMVIPSAVSTTNQPLQAANQRLYGGF